MEILFATMGYGSFIFLSLSFNKYSNFFLSLYINSTLLQKRPIFLIFFLFFFVFYSFSCVGNYLYIKRIEK